LRISRIAQPLGSQAEMARQRSDLLERKAAHGLDLALDRRLIAWGLSGQVRELSPDQSAQREDDREGREHGKED
jgi:hypothetical protein